MTSTIDGGSASSVATLTIDGGSASSAATLTIDGGNAGRSWSGQTVTPRAAVEAISPERLRVIRQGDPRLIMGPNGTRLQFTEGQPLMDEGLENDTLISLFTRRGWCGNKFLTSPIGSDFEDACDAPITRQSLNRIRTAAESAVKGARVTVANPNGNRLSITVLREQDVALTRTAGAWTSQAVNPAYPRII